MNIQPILLPCRIKRALLRSVFVSAAIVMQGCVIVGVDYQSPVVSAPDAWTRSVKGDVNRRSGLTKWWKAYNDPALNQMIEKTRTANPNLKIASQNIEIARAQRGVAESLALPGINGDASYSRNRASRSLFATGPAPTPSDLYVAGFDAGWDLDIFAGLRRNIEASDAIS